MKFYQYSKCSTCRKAQKFLESEGIAFTSVAIVDTPPSLAELKNMLKFIVDQGGTLKNLFNTSGVQYRELGMSQKLKEGLSDSDALKILSSNGKLIKRPFMISKTGGTVGFKPENILNAFRN